MRSPSYHAVQIRLLNVEVHIKSVHHVQVVAFAQDIVNHLDIGVSFFLVSSCVRANLDSC